VGRKLLRSTGEKLQQISLGHVYTGMGVLSASGFILLVDVTGEYSIPELVYSPRTWLAITLGTAIFIVIGILIQALFSFSGRGLVSLASWYPNWYYFPRIQFTPGITPEREIELTLTNPSRNNEFSLQAAYARLDSQVRPLPSLAMGVAPIRNRTIFPLAKMPPRSERKRVVGKIRDGLVELSMGQNAEEKMELTGPGSYTYHIAISGEYRERPYSGGTKFRIVVRENNEVIVTE